MPDLAAVFAEMSASHGVITTSRARRLGLDRRTERRLIATGIVRRPLPAVLVASGAPPTWHQRAMIAVSLPGVHGLCHGAAARLHGLAGFEDHRPIDVLVAPGYRPDPPEGVLVHYSRRDPRDAIIVVDALPTLDIATMICLLGAVVPPDRVGRVLDEIRTRGIGDDEIRNTALRWRRRGRAGPRCILDLLGAAPTSSRPDPAR